MGEPKKIGEILKANIAKLEQEFRCEQCGEGLKYKGRKWCRRCVLAWQRELGDVGDRAKSSNAVQDLCRIDQIVPDRYRTASYVDLSTSILARIQKLEMSQGILFWGTPGTGKSHALSAILNERFYGGHDVARETYEMLCLKIRDTYKSGSKLTELHVINPLIEVETLVIEDVGTTVSVGEQESDFSLRTFLVLLDKRLEWCRPTFISTNKSVEELGKSFDIRVASRLQEACDIIELSGTDRRKQKKLLTANQEAK